MSPPPPAGRSQDRPPGSPQRGPKQRTTPHAQLQQRADFAEISPEVGVLDEDAFAEAVAADPDNALRLLVDLGVAADEKLRAAARSLARRVVLDRVRSGLPRRAGVGKLRQQPADRGGELDVDGSIGAVLEARAAGRPASADELVARDWARPELALCLVVDASGSMNGSRLAAAALTAAACAFRAPGDYAVLSFHREVRLVRAMDSQQRPEAVVDAVLGLRGHGVTAVATALRAAGRPAGPDAGYSAGGGAAVRLPGDR